MPSAGVPNPAFPTTGYNPEHMKPSTRSIPGPIVIGLGIAIGIVLILVLNLPRVVEFTPSPGSEGVSSMARVRLRFNRPMESLSVEGRLQINPDIPGIIYWEGQTLIFEPGTPWPAGSTVTVSLTGGSRALNRLPMLGKRDWSFNVGQPSLVYLWPGEGHGELYQASLDSEADPRQLTSSEFGVQDFSVSSDGALLIYTAYAEGGSTELRAYDLISKQDTVLVICSEETPCNSPVLSPDGDWLAFERMEYVMGAAGRLIPSLTRVWVKPLTEGADAVAVSPPEHTAKAPSWSPTGWLVYYNDRLKALALMNPIQGLDSSPFNYIPSSLGLVGSWSPDGTQLLYPDIVFPGEGVEEEGTPTGAPSYFSHLYLVNVASGRTMDASPGDLDVVEDASPSFSPDGRLIAFTRKFLDPQRWSPGRQLWLMNSDGTNPKPLTDEPEATFSAIAWSPDSERLAFMRKSVADLSQPSEIWWIDLNSGLATLLVEGGTLPQWIP